MQIKPTSVKRSEEEVSLPSPGPRRFLEWLATAALLAAQRPLIASSRGTAPGAGSESTLRVAATQTTPQLGAVDANLAQAEQLVRQAAAKDAALIMLPEMFSSAVALHDDMIEAIRPLDGVPARLLKDLARQENAIIVGSFLAEDAGLVYDTFLLVMPNGTTLRHDKDLPTYSETCYYEKGNADGVLATPLGPMGAALCWEMVRSGTARRLSGKIRLLLAGSTWWKSSFSL